MWRVTRTRVCCSWGSLVSSESLCSAPRACPGHYAAFGDFLCLALLFRGHTITYVIVAIIGVTAHHWTSRPTLGTRLQGGGPLPGTRGQSALLTSP